MRFFSRCDACRASALLLDSVLRKADAKIEAAGGELEKEEVEQIINYVCHISSYHNIELVEWEGKARLAHPHLETWEKRGVPHLQGQVQAPLLCHPHSLCRECTGRVVCPTTATT